MTKQQKLDQITKTAVEVLSKELNLSISDVVKNHSEAVFKMVCIFLATTSSN